jgi:chromate reductase
MREYGQIEIVTLCGSVREKSYNAALVRAMGPLAPGGVVLVPAPLIVNFPHYDADLQEISGPPAVAVTTANAIRDADGLIIVSPEYNYSVPGTLKNAIDWLSRMPKPPLTRKPVLMLSVSAGVLGGSRMQYHLRQILVSQDALVFNKPEIMVGGAASKFDQDGNLTDEPTRGLIRNQLVAFVDFVNLHRQRQV